MKPAPSIEGQGKNTKLLVNGKPFYLRSGEIHNSCSSSLEYMDSVVWPALRNRNMNSVIAPVYWECVEPEEGVFDFRLVDGLIGQAERENMKLVLLWFGTWKNGGSGYVPEWVKLDQKRFFYTQNAGKREATGIFSYSGARNTISPLCDEAVKADKKAFAAFMAHLAAFDTKRTVVTVQVENEIGLLGFNRDYGPAAEKAFREEVPACISELAGKTGTWEEVFGKDAAESFMAYYYALAVEQIASAGKKEYDIPLYVNAWLEQPPVKAGSYPSGGPQFKMHRIWRAVAKHIDFIAPDIYVKNFRDIVDEYASDGNPLFIPEAASNKDVIANYLYAVGQHNAICFAPFGVEDMQGGGNADLSVLSIMNIDENMLRYEQGTAQHLAKAYGYISEMESIIEKAHEEGKIQGFLDNGDFAEIVFGNRVEFEITYRDRKAPAEGPAGGGFVVELGDYEYLFCAVNCSVIIEPREGDPHSLMLLRKEEGAYHESRWCRGRILNGDEAIRHIFKQEPYMIRIKMMPRPIA